KRSSSSAAPDSHPRQSDAHRHADRNGARPSPQPRARCSWFAPSRRRVAPPSRSASSVAAVALLFPRVAVVVVAVGLPEARLVVAAQLQPTHPFGALPEVQVGDNETRGAAVLGRQRLALVLVSDPGLASAEILQRQVRR